MSTPEPFQPEKVQSAVPFDASPKEPGGVGCSRFGLIGCGVVVLLLGVAAVVFLFKAGDLFGWALTQFETEITRSLPDDLADAERQRLREAFDKAADAVRSGEFDPGALQKLQGKLRDSLLDEDNALTREQVLELIVTLEEVAGGSSEEDPAEEGMPAADPAADIAA